MEVWGNCGRKCLGVKIHKYNIRTAEDETLFTFVKFDFIDPACSATLDNNNNNNNNNDDALTKVVCEMDIRRFSSNLVYLHLRHTLIRQLNQQTVLEMILKFKASKNAINICNINNHFSNKRSTPKAG
ncbi:hypothetical protein BCR42DRAFT_398812 [Absidia repens]|uniref:Uncharacterized protein n=1 Tax=Absidia repens TaxID=90262 RepID=A0A1X2HX83_9FUNG|nr:hypothetical protein BCR42DRAFT_398812 [Absidia repens]